MTNIDYEIDEYSSTVDFGRDEDLTDLHAVLADARAAGPALWVRYFGRPAILFTSHDLVSEAFRDEAAFPAAAIYSLTTGPVLGRTVQCMTGDEHRRNRAVAAPPFRAKAGAGYVADLLEPAANELVDTFAGRADADLVAEFTRGYPLLVMSRLLDLRAPLDQVATWAHDLFNFPLDPAGARASATAFTELLTTLIAERRRHPGPDLLSTLATSEIDGATLTDEEILAFARLLFPAGVDTTYLALGNLLHCLLTRPDRLAEARADPAVRTWAVEEGLRVEPSVALLPRICPETTVWHGIAIPADTLLILAIAAANRDPAVYPDPDRFDPGRRTVTALAFGQGQHYCLGAHLARAELRTALAVLLDRLPGLRLAPDAEPRIHGMLGATALRGPDRLPVLFDT